MIIKCKHESGFNQDPSKKKKVEDSVAPNKNIIENMNKRKCVHSGRYKKGRSETSLRVLINSNENTDGNTDTFL